VWSPDDREDAADRALYPNAEHESAPCFACLPATKAPKVQSAARRASRGKTRPRRRLTPINDPLEHLAWRPLVDVRHQGPVQEERCLVRGDLILN
jgi:hypothetical protein